MSARPAVRGSKGMALATGLLLLLFLLPTAMVTVRVARQAMRAAVADARERSAHELANDALMDYMRQFSQSYYSDHYGAGALARPDSFGAAGFSSVVATPDPVAHSVFLEATGAVGGTSRRLKALVQFASDLTRFGTMVNGPFTISASNVVYRGGVWSNGPLSITGWNVRFDGGPVLVNGSVSGSAATVVDGDLYYSGSSPGGVTVTGSRNNFLPSLQWPRLDFSYYNAHYVWKTTASATLVFNAAGTFTVAGGPTLFIPETGAILYGENCSLTVRGTVRGRVTIVAGGPAGSATQGRVTVNGDLVYAGGGTGATARDSIAVLAKNRITFSRSGSNLDVRGIFFVEQGTSNMTLTGSSGRRFTLHGTRSQIITISPGSSFSGGRTLEYDPNLAAFPPPGLPERPMLVNWDLR